MAFSDKQEQMRTAGLRLGIVAACFILTTSAGFADQHEDELHEAKIEHGFELAVFLGATDLEGSERAEPTVGAEVGYRFGRWISLLAFADYVPEVDEIAIGVPILVHLGREGGVKLLAGPTYRFTDHDEDSSHGAHANPIEPEVEDSFGLRLGVLYLFEATSRVGLAPTFELELYEKGRRDTVAVAGLNIVFNLGRRR
jgi:hypothetical protein